MLIPKILFFILLLQLTPLDIETAGPVETLGDSPEHKDLVCEGPPPNASKEVV
jgi:hypothetical protein